MGANLKVPFGESCCDGGECGINDRSAQSCGCDIGANHLCERHALEVRIREEFDNGAREAMMTMLEVVTPLLIAAEEAARSLDNPEWLLNPIKEVNDLVESMK